MINVIFTEQEKKAIHYERYHYPDPRVQRKMEALWLKSHGIPHMKICALVGICEETLRAYIREFREGRIEALKRNNYRRPKSALVERRETLAEYFEENPPATVAEAAGKIKELTGIQRKPTQVRRFLRQSLGLRLRKVASIPAKADPVKQERFKQELLNPLLEEAKAGRMRVFFVDAAHFVHLLVLGYLWTRVRRFIQAPSGRKRFNVLGALDAVTHELITVTNDAYINAESVCQLLRKIAENAAGVPVALVLDNARYQKCKLVADIAESLNIKLVYLPSYSPNLNLIERLWKFVKKQCLYSKYYPDFKSFNGAISECIDQAHTKHKKALDSLLTLNFQIIQKPQNLAA